MRILLTGGSGFIGSHLLIQMLSRDSIHEIVNIDLNDSIVQDPRLKTICVDIRNMDLQDLSIEGTFDVCIHLAAIAKEPGYEWEEYFETNHRGTLNIIALCDKLEIKKIIFTSTMMVYQAGEVQRTEDSITAPDTGYGISKLLAEKELLLWKSQQADRQLKIIRPAVVFGKNEKANFTRLYSSLKKGFFPFIGKSTTIKSNIYVHELNDFIMFLLNNHTQSDVFNFGFPESYTIRQISDTFNIVFGFRPFRPTMPLGLMLFIARFFQLINSLGFKNSIHPRRMEKLYYSTDIYPANALREGYQFKYNLKAALEDWKKAGV